MFIMRMVTTAYQYALTAKEIHSDNLSKSLHDVKLCYLQLIWFYENSVTILHAAYENKRLQIQINPLNAELNPICHLLPSLGAHHIFHVSRIRVKMKHKHSLHRTPLSYDLFLLISACYQASLYYH